jgi:hypothetical protein
MRDCHFILDQVNASITHPSSEYAGSASVSRSKCWKLVVDENMHGTLIILYT